MKNTLIKLSNNKKVRIVIWLAMMVVFILIIATLQDNNIFVDFALAELLYFLILCYKTCHTLKKEGRYKENVIEENSLISLLIADDVWFIIMNMMILLPLILILGLAIDLVPFIGTFTKIFINFLVIVIYEIFALKISSHFEKQLKDSSKEV